jgi:Flp pilus assembly pilin Flp
MRANCKSRRGATVVQVAVLLAIITLAIVSVVKTLGTNAKTSITSTAGNVADPSTLPARFGS